MHHERIPYIDNLAYLVPYHLLRQTPNVTFFTLDDLLEDLAGIDLVIHQPGAKSPRIKGDDTHYWYMHTGQEDNLVVHQGKRVVNLYSVKHGRVETFEVYPEEVWHNGKKINDEPALLGWPPYTFHQVSSPEGSVSTNYARRYENFDLDTNFNIYKLDTETGHYEVVRLGKEDQP